MILSDSETLDKYVFVLVAYAYFITLLHIICIFWVHICSGSERMLLPPHDVNGLNCTCTRPHVLRSGNQLTTDVCLSYNLKPLSLLVRIRAVLYSVSVPSPPLLSQAIFPIGTINVGTLLSWLLFSSSTHSCLCHLMIKKSANSGFTGNCKSSTFIMPQAVLIQDGCDRRCIMSLLCNLVWKTCMSILSWM